MIKPSNKRNILCILVTGLFLLCGCSLRHLTPSQYLLRRNSIILKSDRPVPKRGEIKDNLSRLAAQKLNSHFLGLPMKLNMYNLRYNRLHDKPDTSLPKGVERPVIFDTSTLARARQTMKSYLYNQGYFYASVKDTFRIRKRKAYVTYKITMGKNYFINNLHYDIDDSDIARIVRDAADETALKKGREFSYSLLDEELSRVTSAIRNKGYYKFSQENVAFKLDTMDRSMFRNIESPFEGAVSYEAQQPRKKSTLDIEYVIRLADDTTAYTKFHIGHVAVFPDYAGKQDLSDSGLFKKTIGGIDFRYHENYVHANVLYKHIYTYPDALFSKEDFDKTHAKLTELGIFRYVKIDTRETHRNSDTLDCTIYLDRAKKFDFSTFYNLSSGSTYALGHQVGANIREKNFMHGANLVTFGVNGGFEYAYSNQSYFFNNFSLLTEYYGVNASIDFPKFLAPVASSLFGSNSNLPHTIISGGENVMDRVNFFTLINTSANFSYSWRQTATTSWTLSPVFINIIRLPYESDSFRNVLDSNEYLKNSYKQNFIEGENITFVFDDIMKKHGGSYSYLKLGLEEAGGLLGAVNQLGVALNDLFKINYAQYTKFDFDGRHYFTMPHSAIACRFYGGIGIPYGQSTALPYIKQYFVGGPYSLRGWPIRTLGPGSYYNAADISNSEQVDRTGDIKLEFNIEYRFPIAPLFAGAVKMNGALFSDAGNIWLAQKDPGYPGGEFEFSTLGQDIAVDGGLGLRFDIESFLTFRVDVAMPVKKPYEPANNGWVLNQIAFSNPTWRAANINPVFSIGYPF